MKKTQVIRWNSPTPTLKCMSDSVIVLYCQDNIKNYNPSIVMNNIFIFVTVQCFKPNASDKIQFCSCIILNISHIKIITPSKDKLQINLIFTDFILGRWTLNRCITIMPAIFSHNWINQISGMIQSMATDFNDLHCCVNSAKLWGWIRKSDLAS